MNETNNINNPEQYSSPTAEGTRAYSVNAGEADEISLKERILKLQEWWEYLLSKWLIIVIAGVVGGVLGLAYEYAYPKKPLYTAELTFVLEGGKQGGGSGNYAGLSGPFGIDMGGSAGVIVFENQNLLVLMKSRLMIEKALLTTVNVKGKKETLAEYYIDMNRPRDMWWAKENSKLKKIRFLPGADPSGFSLKQNSLISSYHSALIKNNLFVDKKDKESSIISMRVTSSDELFSKYFTEALAKEVSDFYIDTKIKKSIKNLAILHYQADSVRREFNAAISGVASAIDANPNANPSRQTLGVPSQRRQVDAQANAAMLIELMKNLAVSQISLREETPLIQIIDKPVLPLPKEEFSKKQGSISGGVLGGFIAVFLLAFKKILKDIMA